MPVIKILQTSLEQTNKRLIFETNSKLEEFRNSASCWYSESDAFKLLTQLKGLLLEDEYNKLAIAFSHKRIGEDSGEILHDVCNRLIAKYKTIPNV